jgi:hypothetical protein
VPLDVFQSLVASLVLTRLDYGNATLAGISVKLINRLQSVLNAAARTIVGVHRQDHINQILADLHWLGTAERIDFKLAVTVSVCTARLRSTCHVTFALPPVWPLGPVFDLRRRRPFESRDADCPLSLTVLSQLSPQKSGTV